MALSNGPLTKEQWVSYFMENALNFQLEHQLDQSEWYSYIEFLIDFLGILKEDPIGSGKYSPISKGDIL